MGIYMLEREKCEKLIEFENDVNQFNLINFFMVKVFIFFC